MARQITVQTVPVEGPEEKEKKSHRYAWIGAGAGAAVLAAGLHGGLRGYRLPGGGRGNLIDAIKATGKEEFITHQKAAKVHETEEITRHAAEALRDWTGQAPAYHHATIHDYNQINSATISATTPDRQFHVEGLGYYNTAVRRHSQIAFKNVAAKDYVYRARPFGEKFGGATPKPGRFMPREEAVNRDIIWAKGEGKRRYLLQKKAEEETTKKFSRFIEFDVRLNESRGKGGKFVSGGGMPMLSPRDMQYAYHAPVMRQQMQQQQPSQPSKSSKLAKYAVAGIGGAIGIGALIAGSAPLWQKRGAELARVAQEKAAKKASRKVAKQARQAIQVTSVGDPGTQAQLKIAQNQLVHQEEIGKMTGQLATAQGESKEKDRLIKKLQGRIQRGAKREQAKDVITSTYAQVIGGGAKPVLSVTTPFGRQKHLWTHEDAHAHFSNLLAGDTGKINRVNATVMRLKGEIAKSDVEGGTMTPYAKQLVQIRHDAYEEQLNKHMSHLETLKAIPRIGDPKERTKAWEDLHLAIRTAEQAKGERITREVGAARVAEDIRKANLLPKNDPMADAIAIQAQGYGAVSKKGGKPTSKQRGRNLSTGSLENLVLFARFFERLTPLQAV